MLITESALYPRPCACRGQDVAFLSKLRADQGPPASTREGMNSAGPAIQSISIRPPWAELSAGDRKS